MNMNNRRNPVVRRAFSLIELLLVLVILAVLAAIVVPKFTGRGQQARETAAKANISILSNALAQFEIDTGRYPTNDEGLEALVRQPSGAEGWRGPYIERGVPKDPWGNDFGYRQPGQRNPTSYDLYSLGADGREGNDDIGNWDVATN
ncbi:MAG TPA: type II secretion system major pseudopilin GspG [Tepidisphaeraceae bacterium]|nr:type II secretion system major pseudopilin GspG [Tepidisphaeraceae bacterium]